MIVRQNEWTLLQQSLECVVRDLVTENACLQSRVQELHCSNLAKDHELAETQNKLNQKVKKTSVYHVSPCIPSCAKIRPISLRLMYTFLPS